MIDLRRAGLPRAIECPGGPVPVITSFRAWIEFERCLREEHAASLCVFPGGREPGGVDWIPGAVDFLLSPNDTPRDMGRGSSARAIDLVRDGEYIVGSFQQAYGIDLTDPSLDMHWHRFKALVACLPDDTRMKQVMGWRTWRNDSRRHAAVMAELRDAWKLPDPEDERYLELQQRLFGDIR